jgi:hypothetical protein
LHVTADADVRRLMEALEGEMQAAWGITASATILTADAPMFEYA